MDWLVTDSMGYRRCHIYGDSGALRAQAAGPQVVTLVYRRRRGMSADGGAGICPARRLPPGGRHRRGPPCHDRSSHLHSKINTSVVEFTMSIRLHFHVSKHVSCRSNLKVAKRGVFCVAIGLLDSLFFLASAHLEIVLASVASSRDILARISIKQKQSVFFLA